ncbi:MAG: SBBP repeat-containing protein [Bryobacteraceae bacterium]
MHRSLGLPSLLALLAACLHAAPPAPSLAVGRAALEGLPLRFEANQGQWSPEVRYLARGGSVKVALTDRGPSLRLPGTGRVDMVLEGARQPRIEPLEPLAARTDYFIGDRSNWHTGVASFARVRYAQVYRGIDAVYYGNQGRLEYDFLLAPGADASAIRMRFRGADRLRITPDGDLQVEAGGNTIVEKRPAARQGDVAIAGRYVLLARDVAAFRVGRYDRSRALVIDPLLVYSTYIGGTGNDTVTAVQLTSSGLLYVTGSTNSSNMPFINGAYSNGIVIPTATNVFLAILDTTAAGGYQPTYFGYIGGFYADTPLAMVIDATGDAYITGTTTSTNFPMIGNSILPNFPVASTSSALTGVNTTGLTQTFVLELNPALYGEVSLLYSTFLGGTLGNTYGYAIDLDQAGNIYVVGTTLTGDFPVTGNCYQNTLWGGQDAFLTEFNTVSSTPIYSTYLGGEMDDDGRGVAVAANGLVYMAASTGSTEFPMAGYSYQGNLAGGYDVVLAVLDPNQFGTESLIYATYLGGSGSDEVRGMAVDASGNVLLTGYTLSSDFPVTADAAQPANGGDADIFVAVVNPFNPQFLLYSTYLGGSDAEVGYGIGADAENNVYVTGYTLSSDLPTTANAPLPTYPGGVDIVAAKVIPHVPGPSGFGYLTYFGGASISSGQALAVAPDGTLYFAGFTGGGITTTSDAAQGAYGGGVTDGFLAVFAP